MTLVDGHNEIAMTFFILCAFYLLVRSKYAASFIFLALAIAVKFVYVLLAPLFVLHILLDKGVKSVKEKIYGIVAGAASFVFITAVAWFPFGMKSVRAIFNYYAELGRNFWFDSIPYAVYFILGKTGMPVPKDMISGIFLCMFIAAYLSVLVYYLKKGGADKQALFTSSALILLTLLFTNSTPFQAWYLVWVIPLILLSDIKLKFQLVFLLSYFLIMTFWKRMCVLAVPMIIAYSLALLFYKDNPFKGRIKKCVKMY
jgi:alpha-1,6-mannosyltransferase